MTAPAVGHTPGPWIIDPAEDVPLGIIDRQGDGICEMGDKLADEADPETLANARLIAAAPEMLAALRDMVDMLALDRLEEGMAVEYGYPELFTAARDAIAKATGHA